MVQIVKVYRLSDRGMEIQEIDFQQAERLVEEAYARGSHVVNKKEGEVIYKLGPNVEELLIVDVVAGG